MQKKTIVTRFSYRHTMTYSGDVNAKGQPHGFGKMCNYFANSPLPFAPSQIFSGSFVEGKPYDVIFENCHTGERIAQKYRDRARKIVAEKLLRPSIIGKL